MVLFLAVDGPVEVSLERDIYCRVFLSSVVSFTAKMKERERKANAVRGINSKTEMLLITMSKWEDR